MASDDRHGYAQLTRFLTAAALAQCEVTQVRPPRPVITPAAPLAAAVDRQLHSLWGPA
jgi:hypothetical protein